MSKKIQLWKALIIGIIVMIGGGLVLTLIIFSTERIVDYKMSRTIEATLEGVEKRGEKIYLRWESEQSTLQGGLTGWGGSQFFLWVALSEDEYIFPNNILGKYLHKNVKITYRLRGNPPNHFFDVDDNRLRRVKVISFKIIE